MRKEKLQGLEIQLLNELMRLRLGPLLKIYGQ